jgi:hypothetical protein
MNTIENEAKIHDLARALAAFFAAEPPGGSSPLSEGWLRTY